LGIQLAHEFLGADLPLWVRTQMKNDSTAAALAQEIRNGFFLTGARALPKSITLGTDLYYLRTKERWQDRLPYLRYSAGWFLSPSPKDREWVRLPARLSWVYIFLRPIRVFCHLVRPPSRNLR
jgi:hypothetical protein